jgi:hypothetical protein
MQLWSAKVGAAVSVLPIFLASTGLPAAPEVGRAENEAHWNAQVSSPSASATDAWANTTNSVALHGAGDRFAVGEPIFVEVTSATQTLLPSNFDETPRQQPDASAYVNAFMDDAYARRINDALGFSALLTEIEWRPNIWADDAEVVFEWIKDDKHAVVSFEGDGLIGYTLLKNDVFVAGDLLDPPATILPPDLREYLSA